MILVDTSVWIDHFRATARAAALPQLLEAEQIVVHPWVVGELALGRTAADCEIRFRAVTGSERA